jgi:hypothetical protein
MMLKPGVSLFGIKPETVVALMVAQAVYQAMGYDLVVTSCTDGPHGDKSYHRYGYALDLRTRHMSPGDAQTARDRIAEALPGDFDVILEGDHIHLEFDRRPSEWN